MDRHSPVTESPTVSSFAPLRRRAFRIVWIGALISNVGSWMQAASLGYYTANLTGSAGWSAAVAAAEFAPTALLVQLVEHWQIGLRKLVVLAMTITQGLLAGLLTWAMIFGSPARQCSLPCLWPMAFDLPWVFRLRAPCCLNWCHLEEVSRWAEFRPHGISAVLWAPCWEPCCINRFGWPGCWRSTR